METDWNLIDTMEQDGFTIRIYVTPEEIYPCDTIDDGEMLQANNDGAYAWFQVKVTATKCGIELADEYYSEPAEFLENDCYWADMRDSVIYEAKLKIEELKA